MNYAQYAPLAIRTAKFISPSMDIVHACMGIVTEVGEIVDCFKRHVIYGKPLDLVNLEEEIGDAFWYLNLYWHSTHTSAKPPLDDAEFAKLLDAVKQSERSSGGLPTNMLSLAVEAANVAIDVEGSFMLQRQLEMLANTHSIDIGVCLEKNIMKLAARYGDKYSDFKATNRDLAAERAVLE